MNFAGFAGFADAIADGKPASPPLWWVVHAGSGVKIVRVPADASAADVQVAVQEKTGDETHVRIKERCAADCEFQVSRIDDRERLIALAARCSGGNAKWMDIVASWKLCKPVSSWLYAEFEGNTVVELNLSICGLTGKLDVTSCAALTRLDCYDNQLQILNVSSCVALTHLYCYNNQLPTLDVSNCITLARLFCSSNRLSALDVSSCTALTRLACSSNQISALNVSNCVALNHLSCYSNQLQVLDVSSCTALNEVYCSSNQLRVLDVSNCVALRCFDCHNNQLQTLDVSSCVALTQLFCNNNRLQALDVSSCIALTSFGCSDQPTTFKLIGWPRSS
jgi:hypothetical protein